jgi:flagellar motor switch protein FliM
VPANTVRTLHEGPVLHPGRRGSVLPYDFRRPTKLSREHARMLQIAYEAYARRATTLLTSTLRQVCLVSVREITQCSYEEYITGLAPQTLIAPISIPPLPGSGMLEFSLPVALAAVDHMLGGPGGTQPQRPLTEIETVLLRNLIGQLLDLLQYSLQPIAAITPELAALEYNPQFVQAAGATDAVVVGEFDLAIGAQRCRSTLCLPLGSLLPRLLAQHARTGGVEDETQRAATAERLRERLGGVALEVAVRFTSVELSPARILALTEGEIIPLAHRVGTPLAVQIGQTTFAHAVAGKSGSRLAALIVDTPQEFQ